VLPFGLTQPKEQPRHLQQLSHFYMLPFLRKKLGDLRTWMHHVYNLLGLGLWLDNAASPHFTKLGIIW